MRRTIFGLLLTGASALAYGCGGTGDAGLFDTTGSSSSGTEGAGAGGATGTQTGTGAGGSTGTQTGTGGNGGNGGTGGAAQCKLDADCDTLLGPSPCGAWACTLGVCAASSPGCTDADHDGYGSGAACACAGLDCDDTDSNVGASAQKSCYSGPAGTAGVGTCLAGLTTCTAGSFGPCVGEVTPSGEACNSLDDNCNGTVDEGLGSFTCGLGVCQKTVAACTKGVVGACVAGPPAALDGPTCNGVDDDCDGPVDEDCKSCIPVSTGGNDGTANGSLLLPFKTLQAAIDWAATHAGPKTVCASAGAVCGTQNAPVTGTYANQANATVTMANGVSVLGNYESTTWSRCASFTTTVIQPKTPAGVTFPAAVNTVTVLDGFRIDRFNSPTTAAVTLDGATNAILSTLTINNAPSVTNSYAINLINGAQATITQGRIDAGTGSAESIAVRSVGSKVTLTNNCASLNAQGRCDDFCNNNPSIRGRTTAGPGVTYAVLLSDSPGSKIEGSALCANAADQGAPIRIAGDGAGIVIRTSLVNAFGGVQDSHGIWMEDCKGAAPWIVDNHLVAAAGTNVNTRVDGVRAIGDCHPVIDTNQLIAGGGEGQSSNPNGVYCGANAQAVASKCVVLGNVSIAGSQFGFPPVAVGVRCDDGGCNKIANNTITGRGGVDSYGIWLGSTGTFVDNNLIRGGCSTTATGVYTKDSFARIQNNRVFGFMATDCGPGGMAQVQSSYGMRVYASAGGHEIDVHSNDIDGAGSMGACTSRGVQLDITGAAPSSGVGIFRNNILRGGVCATARYGFVELVAGADPRIFEHNDLDPFGGPTALYLDEGANVLTTAAGVDLLSGANGTIAMDAKYVAYPNDLHISAGSPCDGAGTPTGAPATDLDGAPRDPVKPDIGADER